MVFAILHHTRPVYVTMTWEGNSESKETNLRSSTGTTSSNTIKGTKTTPKRFCDEGTGPCLFDVGFNHGQSTAYYFDYHNAAASPAPRVLAVEANPLLVEQGLKRFHSKLSLKDKDNVSSGSNPRFKLVHAGIAGKAGETLDFWVNTIHDKFGSFYESIGCRLPSGEDPQKTKDGSVDHTYCRQIKVDTITCADLLRTHGTPQYLKVDVEGMDKTCLRSLFDLDGALRPQFVSKENLDITDFEYLGELGYTKFKVVNQAVLELKFKDDPTMRGSSGPWGNEAEDMFVGREWQSAEELKISHATTHSHNGERP